MGCVSCLWNQEHGEGSSSESQLCLQPVLRAGRTSDNLITVVSDYGMTHLRVNG